MPPSTANDTILTDDYVAQLLSKEADDRSLKYSSLGLDAYKSQGCAHLVTPLLLAINAASNAPRRPLPDVLDLRIERSVPSERVSYETGRCKAS